MIAGTLLALALARPLNVLAMGDDTARALGARPDRVSIEFGRSRFSAIMGPSGSGKPARALKILTRQ